MESVERMKPKEEPRAEVQKDERSPCKQGGAQRVTPSPPVAQAEATLANLAGNQRHLMLQLAQRRDGLTLKDLQYIV